MREILFRGKQVDNGEWVYGDVLHNSNCVKIRENETDINYIARSYQVIPETVGQYTGICDKNGAKIFENDILRVTQHEKTGSVILPVYFGEYIDADSDVEDYHCIGFYLKTPDGCGTIGLLLDGEFECEVIGNVFDNSLEELQNGN